MVCRISLYNVPLISRNSANGASGSPKNGRSVQLILLGASWPRSGLGGNLVNYQADILHARMSLVLDTAANIGGKRFGRGPLDFDYARPGDALELSGFNLWLLRRRLKQAEALELVGEAGTVRGVQPRHG